MPSSWSASLRYELQFTGESINLWGDKLNTVLSHIDFSVAGLTTKALTADYALTTANAADDEARAAILKFTGTGAFTVTVPSLSKVYQVWNGCTGTVTLSTGAGTTAAVLAGEVVTAICDGSNVKRVVAQSMGSNRLQDVADPTSAQDAATKAYADALAFTANAGILPGQAGNAGAFLKTDGSVASWLLLTSANLTDTAARDAVALGRAVAFAVAL